MRTFLQTVLLSAAVITALFRVDVRAQSLLEDPSFFATVVGLNTVPDHGEGVVSFLDYRNGSYVIMAVDVETGVEDQLERVFYAEPVVRTHGEHVAWIGYSQVGQPDVYVHDRTSSRTSQVTSDADFQNHPDLSDGLLIWQDYRNAGSDGKNADIYMHDFASGTTSPVTTDPGYQDLPRVHGKWVVWQDYRHADSLKKTADIYAYDLVVNEERRLTSGTFYRTHPAVWEDLVVWEDHRNGEGDIYLYDLSTGDELQITADPAHQGYPTVHGEWVLWLDYRNSREQGDLYGYHLGSQEEHALLVHPAHQEAPHVYENHVVWQDYRNGRFDLFEGTLLSPRSLDVDGDPRPPGLTLTAAPNPFARSVTFSVTSANVGPQELTIYDALGRQVARRQISAGDAAASWDGFADSGWSTPAGVYIAVLRASDVFQQIVVVRHP